MGVGTDLPRLGHELGRNENGESLFPVDAVCRLPLCSWRGEPFTLWIACGMALILAGIVVVVQALRPLCTLAGQPCGVASRIAAMERRVFFWGVFLFF